jgi:MFS family permease
LRSWREALGARARTSPRYQWWVLWVALSGLLATNLLFTVFVVALPQVAHGLRVSVATVTWTVTGPMLAFGVIAPLAGKAGDLWGQRRMFLLGVTAEIGVAILSAAAPNAGVLIAARTLGGAVGASIGSASMALVLSVFDKHDRVKALGFWSLVGAGGPVVGVAVGGPIIQLFGWRWMFILQVPLLIIATLLAAAVLPTRAVERRHVTRRQLDLDWAGAGSLAVAAGSFLFALNRAPEWGWTHPMVLGAFALSPFAAVVFGFVERRASEPVFPPHYLGRRNFVFPIAAQTFSNFAYLGAFFLSPLLLEKVYGYANDQSAVGFLVLPRPIVFSAIAPIAGYVAYRIGERTSAVIGTSAVALSMAVFALTGHSSGLVLVEVALVLSGVGLGVASPSLSSMVSNEFAAEDLGTASGSQQLMNQVGTVAGIQVMQTVQASAYHGRSGAGALLGSFHLAYVVGGAVALVGVVAAALSRSTVREDVVQAVRVAPLDADTASQAALRPAVLAASAESGPATLGPQVSDGDVPVEIV